MNLIHRRGFLKGVLTSVGAGTALVTLATPEEVKALTVDEPLLLGHVPKNYAFPSSNLGDEVYMKQGEQFVPVGYLIEVMLTRNVMDTSSWDGTVEFLPGLMRAQGKFTNR